MYLARVVGNVVSTHKDPKFIGTKLLMIQRITASGEPQGDVFIAIDAVGAGNNEIVLVVTGNPARFIYEERSIPTDSAIVGIVDNIEIYDKSLRK